MTPPFVTPPSPQPRNCSRRRPLSCREKIMMKLNEDSPPLVDTTVIGMCFVCKSRVIMSRPRLFACTASLNVFAYFTIDLCCVILCLSPQILPNEHIQTRTVTIEVGSSYKLICFKMPFMLPRISESHYYVSPSFYLSHHPHPFIVHLLFWSTHQTPIYKSPHSVCAVHIAAVLGCGWIRSKIKSNQNRRTSLQHLCPVQAK